MSRNISTELAPAAIGPYVQGVDLGSMIITSGQIPVDPKTGAVADDVPLRRASRWKTSKRSSKPPA